MRITNLTLQDFRSMAGSESSIGYVVVSGEENHHSLSKVNNHKHLTSKNIGPAQGDAAGNRQVREEFYTAIATALAGGHDDYLASVRRQLGLNGDGLAPQDAANPCKPLDRRTVRALTQATDALLKNGHQTKPSGVLTCGQKTLVDFLIGKTDSKALNQDLIFELYDGLARMEHEKLSDVWVDGIGSGESIHLSRLQDGKVRMDLGTKAYADTQYRMDFVRWRCAMALVARQDTPPAYIDKILVDIEALFREKAHDFGAWSGIMSDEIRAVRDVCQELIRYKLGAYISDEMLATVSPHLMSRLALYVCSNEWMIDAANRGPGWSKALADGVKQLIALHGEQRLTSVEVQSMMSQYLEAKEKSGGNTGVSFKPPAPVEAPQEAQVENVRQEPDGTNKFLNFLFGVKVERNPPPPEAQSVQNMLADIVSNSKTFMFDRHRKPGERLQQTLLEHIDTVASLVLNSEPVISQLPEMVRPVAQELVDVVSATFDNKINRGDLLASVLQLSLKSPLALPKLAEAESAIESAATWLSRRLQHQIMVSFDKAINPPTGAQAQNQGADDLIAIYDSLIDEKLSKIREGATREEILALLDRIDDAMEAYTRDKSETIEVKQRFLNDISEYLGRALEPMGGNLENGLKVRDQIGPAGELQRGWDWVKNQVNARVNMVLRTHQSVLAEKKLPDNGIQNLNDFLKANKIVRGNKDAMKASRKLLDKLGGDGDIDSGFGAYMKTAMWRYLRQMSTGDQRSMLAAGIRFTRMDDGDVRKFAACMKGAGPIMQKMLQGLASMGINVELSKALEDMKSNLPEIPKEVVEAYLLEVMRESNGEITEIQSLKVLGTASVGQTNLCKVKCKSEPTEREIVVKMLRPEIEARIDREKALFLKAAKDVPGMSKTISEQLDGILEELDFRCEARNIDDGKVYDAGAPDVKAVKRLNLIKPTRRLLVLEKAPGDNVGNVVKKAREEIKRLTELFYEDRPVLKDGKTSTRWELKVDLGAEGHSRLVKEFPKVMAGLSDLYGKLYAHQRRLVELARKWTLHAIYSKEGYFHGDLHAGNIMVDDKDGLTVIDFGNATHLTKAQQSNVLRMMNAASVRNTNVFLDDFSALMSPEGRVRFNEPATRKKIHDLVHNILNLGDESNTADRIFAILQQLQQHGFELPGPIFKFSQCAVRLQGTIHELNELLHHIREVECEIVKCTRLRFGHRDANDHEAPPDELDPVAAVFRKAFDEKAEEFDPVQLVKIIDKRIDDYNSGHGFEKMLLARYLPMPYIHPTRSGTVDSGLKDIISRQVTMLNSLQNGSPSCGLGLALINHFNQCQEKIDVLDRDMRNIRNGYAACRNRLYRARYRAVFEAGAALLRDDKAFCKAYDGAVTEELRRKVVDDKIMSLWKRLAEQYEDETKATESKKINDLIVYLSRELDPQNGDRKTRDYARDCATELNVTQSEVPKADVNKPEEKQFDEDLKDFENNWQRGEESVVSVMKEFARECGEAQIAMLRSMRTGLMKMIKVDKKGKMSRKVVYPNAIDNFASGVGEVISDNLVMSTIKQGFAPTFDMIWKLGFSKFSGYKSEPKE